MQVILIGLLIRWLFVAIEKAVKKTNKEEEKTSYQPPIDPASCRNR